MSEKAERRPSVFENPEDELKEPYENVKISAPIVPFPEAVVADPVIAGRRQVGTFENDSLESFYKPIDAFEGSHRYDPKFEWDAKEEKRLVRKVSNNSTCVLLHCYTD